MARPIKETPTISGKDARRFQEAMDNLVPVSDEVKADQRRAYEYMKSIATFPMPWTQQLYKNTSLQNAGCRFIVVDAYRDALSFYEKNGFKYLTENDKNDATRIMYLDLMAFV